MKKQSLKRIAALGFAGALVLSGFAAPVKIIFDTDMITDFDDVGALACLHALADAGECEILATISSARGNASVGAVEVISHYYGRGDLPVGAPMGMGVMGVRAGSKTKVDPNSPPERQPHPVGEWLQGVADAGFLACMKPNGMIQFGTMKSKTASRVAESAAFLLEFLV